jgi:putative transposase
MIGRWRRDVLGLRAGAGGGESAKFWMNVLAEIKNRGVRDLSSWSATGSKVYPTAFPATTVQAASST